jgi:hypothetical protein
MWNDNTAQTYYTTPTPTKDAKANARAYKAHAAAAEIHAMLYPEDD